MSRITYSAKEVSEMTGLSMSTVRRLISSGKLPATRVGRKVVITKNSLDKYVNELDRQGAKEIASSLI